MNPFPDPAEALAINRAGWDQVAARFHGRTALPVYGPLAPTEESLRLLPPVAGARVLEVGCGSGHSLRYLAEQGAAELWGLDLPPRSSRSPPACFGRISRACTCWSRPWRPIQASRRACSTW